MALAKTWKEPDEVLDYTFDFSADLGGSDTIDPASVTVTATGVTVNSSSAASSTVAVWLSGGVLGTVARLTVRVATNGGRTLDAIARIPIGRPPVTLGEGKSHCRVDGTDEDDLVAGYIAAAVGHVEQYTGTRLITQTVTRTFPRFPLHQLPLGIGPVQSVSVSYLDASGAPQTLDPSTYRLIGAGTLDAWIEVSANQRWPQILHASDAVTVTMIVGYGDGDDVPLPVKQAILLLVGDFYSAREDTIAERGVVPATLPNGVDALLSNYRVF